MNRNSKYLVVLFIHHTKTISANVDFENKSMHS